MSSPGTCPQCNRWYPDLPSGSLCQVCLIASSQVATAFEQQESNLAPEPPTLKALDAHTTNDAPTQADRDYLYPDGYDILEDLGSGGMGRVCKAREKATGRIVAIKFMQVLTHPTAVERFKVEARAMASVKHPSVVQIFHVNPDGREPFFTMEYLAGGSLSGKINGQPIDPTIAARIMEFVARAVVLAHDRGILHRDIKPSNILFESDGTPKLADFGLAKCLDDSEKLTATDSLLGTPSYMAPEQAARKNSSIGPAADIYSLGATLYDCLTGKPPFKGITPMQTAMQVVNDPPVPPRKLKSEIPPDLEAVCLKCLEKDPARRYATAEALADDLARFQRGDPTMARPLSAAGRTWRRARRNWRWGALAAVLFAAVGIGAALRPNSNQDPIPPEDPDAVIKEYQRELQAGRKVTLIGETGLPRWHKSHFNPAVVEVPQNTEGVCTALTPTLSLVELLPDPGINNYRYEAEVRKIAGFGQIPPGAQTTMSRFGIYFSGASTIVPVNRPAMTSFNITFNDMVPVPPPGKAPITPTVRFKPGLDIMDPKNGVLNLWASGKDHAFTPASVLPGPWRKFAVDITTDSMTAWWYPNPKAPPQKIATWTIPQTIERYASLKTQFDLAAPGSGIAPTPWSPRLSLGLWCLQSSMGVRNVTLSPIGDPPAAGAPAASK